MHKRILISRTDSIGDVMLTLPMLVWIKEKYPDSELLYLGRDYTEPVIRCFDVVDRFVNWTEIENRPSSQRVEILSDLKADVIIHVFPHKEIATLAKKAKIPMRIGTSHRAFHLLTCNHRLNFTRKRSDLHESQLNFELLRPLGLKEIPTLNELIADLAHFQIPSVNLPENIENKLNSAEKGVILHPKSQGSAVEWPIDNYVQLALQLAEKNITVFFTGTEKEGAFYRDQLPSHERIIDTSGQMSLDQLICFIGRVDALVACSTGPLHIAGFAGIRAIGLFSPKKPIHPGRWGALGKSTRMLVFNEDCPTCKKGKNCNCIESITVDQVAEALL